jgi:aerobic carbon-monoxide dehydrogenase large subunit
MWAEIVYRRQGDTMATTLLAAGRLEDNRLLTGFGRYVADLNVPGVLHAIVVRSPHAHADVLAVDVEAARAATGVVAVLTATDLTADGISALPWSARSPSQLP